MKNKYVSATMLFICFTIISTIGAQDNGDKEMKTFEIENESIKKSTKDLRVVFTKMISTSLFDNKKGTGSCKPEDLVSKISIDGLMSGDDNLNRVIETIKKTYLNYPQHLQDAPSREAAYSFDIKNFKSMEDGALSAFSNTNNFADFVKTYTGVDVGDLNKFDIRTVENQYHNLKANYDMEFYIETESFNSLSCSHKATSYIKLKKLNYPNATWQIRTVVTADCDCSIAVSEQIKNGTVEYKAETTGLLTTTSINFGNVKNAKVDVTSLVCCPVKEEEESKIALKDENTYINPAQVNEPKEYVETGWGKKEDGKGYLQVSAYVGLPLGDEKDFYSLNFGAEVTYLFNISEHFSAGVGAGYTHFTPKEFTVGSSTFKGEGIGYAPIFAAAQYEFSEKINVGATLGYALSTDSDVDGGLYCDVSFGWEVTPNYTIRPRIQFISLGEDRHFNSFGIGVSRSF